MTVNQEPRVLVFSITFFPFVGGAEIAIKEITDRIYDYKFDLICARLDKKLNIYEKIGNINVYRVGRGWILDKYLYPWLAYYKAKKLHQQKRYQLIQAIMPFYAGLVALFFKLKYPQIKYLLTDQSGDSDLFVWLRTWFWYPVFKQIYTKADYIQVISKFLAQRARKYGYQGKIEIVPNGVDIEKFKRQNSKSKIEIQKSKLRIAATEKIVITVSRLVKKNGIADLIKAVKDLEVKLLILGIGPDEKKLKNLVSDLKLQQQVLFLGYIKHKDLPDYLAVADVFVRPSLSEGLGNAFLEAMACGIPIIGTPVGGIIDFLIDPEQNPEQDTGLYCQPKNPQSIAQKIKEILENNQLKEKLVQNGLRLVLENYNWDKISQKMKDVYSQIIS